MFPFLCLICFCVFTVAASQCLEEAVSIASLQPVRMGDKTAALGLWSQNFSSSRHITALYALLVREMLGFRTDVKLGGNRPAPGIHALGNCFYESAGFVCGSVAASNHHVALDVWNSTSVSAAVDQIQSASSASTPTNLGSMGYAGKSGVFVPSTVQTAVGANRMTLTSYLTYQSVDLTNMFDKFSDLAPDKLRHCFNTAMARSGVVSNYLLHSNDHAGTISGGATARCWNSSFWFSPSCRSEPSRCIPVIAIDRGHSVEALMIKAASHTLPWAVAVAKDWDAYSYLVSTYKVLFYQWEPDLECSPNAAEVLFPAHDPTEWREGNMRTSEPTRAVQKWAFGELRQFAPAAHFLAERLQLSMQSVQELLLTDSDPDVAACKWLLAKRDKWQTWVPSTAKEANWTNCPTGSGLVSPLGAFLTQRALTASCRPCPPGRMSESFRDTLGQTQRCSVKSQDATQDGQDVLIVVISLSAMVLLFIAGAACYRKYGCLNVCLVTATGQWGRLSRSYSARVIAWASPRGSAKKVRLPEETATGSVTMEDLGDVEAEVASSTVPKISVVQPVEPRHSQKSVASASSQATPQASPRMPGPPLPPKLAFTAVGEQLEANMQRRPSNSSDPFAASPAVPLQVPQHDIAAASPGGTPRVSRPPNGSSSWRRRPSKSPDPSARASPAPSATPSPRPPSARGFNPSTKHTPKSSPRTDSTPLPPKPPLLHAPIPGS